MTVEVLAMFAEDVRQEVGNKFSLMGILHNEIVVPSDEGIMPRLVIALLFKTTKGDKLEDVIARVTLPDDSRHEVPVDFAGIDIRGITAIGGIIQSNMILSPALLRAGKSYRVDVAIKGRRRLAGELRIRSGHISQTETQPILTNS